MKKQSWILLLATLSAVTGAQASEADKAPAAADRHKFMKEVDTNNDGMISKAEYVAASEKIFARIDANKDGQITADEFKAQRAERMEKRQEKTEKRQKAIEKRSEQKPKQ